MSGTLERTTPKPPATGRLTFILRFGSTIALWTVALLIIFSGYELAFFALIGSLGLISLWEFYGMLDHRGLPNFKITGMVCGSIMLCGSFYYFSKVGPADRR
jgi:CDP-diglyceride synthetase